ncbi:MAG TPA: FtsW/RodA/SpoVE family cell cycle protein [Chlamydiales bacterium]|nr:FtsW/RodA/SpoVE family cell cycle protein [Chlamydiales bacterium]
MFKFALLKRIDFRIIILLSFLMIISLAVISSMTQEMNLNAAVFTPYVKSQIKWFVLGWGAFFFFASMDYRILKKWAWPLYILMIVLLIGLYFTSPIQRVHRWYRIPFLGITAQPSEAAKIIVVITLAFFLEKKGRLVETLPSAMQIAILIGLPFLLILKQPDLGTALVLYPIGYVMCYFANLHKGFLRVIASVGLIAVTFVLLIFSNVLSHEKMKPFFCSFMKEYQYERLNPSTYHQNAAQIAISIGGITGSGWRKGEFSMRKWLPAAHTDSVFAAYSEEFGLIGVFFLLLIFYGVIHLSLKISMQAKDTFGHLLGLGIAVYLAMHIIVNIAMMCGLLPISGVPLIMITYGGNSILTTMGALGILQSIYIRRFKFNG